jgi:hypothetical protein
MFEKLTIEKKEQIKLLMCNFIDGLSEDDVLSISGKNETDTFSGAGKKNMIVFAEKKLV